MVLAASINFGAARFIFSGFYFILGHKIIYLRGKGIEGEFDIFINDFENKIFLTLNFILLMMIIIYY